MPSVASLNPIYGDDDGDGGGGYGGGLFGLMAGMGEMMMGGDYGDDGEGEMGGEENADEMVCRLGEGINLTGGFGPATTDAEGGHANDGGATACGYAREIGWDAGGAGRIRDSVG